MGYDIGTQILAPCRQQSVKNSQHADYDHALPSLVPVKEAKYHSLAGDCERDAATQRMELAEQIAAKDHLFADSGSDSGSDPNRDFKQTLWQQAIDSLGRART